MNIFSGHTAILKVCASKVQDFGNFDLSPMRIRRTYILVSLIIYTDSLNIRAAKALTSLCIRLDSPEHSVVRQCDKTKVSNTGSIILLNKLSNLKHFFFILDNLHCSILILTQYMPIVFFVGYRRQTVQTQMRRRKTRRLIWVCTVCLLIVRSRLE